MVANGLRFFFHTTLKRDRTTFTIPAPRQGQKLPAILSREDVEQVIPQATNPKHRAMFLTTYGLYQGVSRLTSACHMTYSEML